MVLSFSRTLSLPPPLRQGCYCVRSPCPTQPPAFCCQWRMGLGRWLLTTPAGIYRICHWLRVWWTMSIYVPRCVTHAAAVKLDYHAAGGVTTLDYHASRHAPPCTCSMLQHVDGVATMHVMRTKGSAVGCFSDSRCRCIRALRRALQRGRGCAVLQLQCILVCCTCTAPQIGP